MSLLYGRSANAMSHKTDLARMGDLTAKLAATAAERDMAFALRHEIFCEQASARPNVEHAGGAAACLREGSDRR